MHAKRMTFEQYIDTNASVYLKWNEKERQNQATIHLLFPMLIDNTEERISSIFVFRIFCFYLFCVSVSFTTMIRSLTCCFLLSHAMSSSFGSRAFEMSLCCWSCCHSIILIWERGPLFDDVEVKVYVISLFLNFFTLFFSSFSSMKNEESIMHFNFLKCFVDLHFFTSEKNHVKMWQVMENSFANFIWFTFNWKFATKMLFLSLPTCYILFPCYDADFDKWLNVSQSWWMMDSDEKSIEILPFIALMSSNFLSNQNFFVRIAFEKWWENGSRESTCESVKNHFMGIHWHQLVIFSFKTRKIHSVFAIFFIFILHFKIDKLKIENDRMFRYWIAFDKNECEGKEKNSFLSRRIEDDSWRSVEAIVLLFKYEKPFTYHLFWLNV